MKDLKITFLNLEKRLKQSSWFEDGWEIYNRGVYLQLYKVNWHNHNQEGIHFETYIEAPQIKLKAFPICMHAEKDCPSQSEFIRKFLELEGDRIKGWKGYQAVGKGYSICQRTLPLNLKKLEQRIFVYFSLLRQLESSVELVLRTL